MLDDPRARISPGLPWEPPAGPSAGIGICVSGGGLRSASFALGAMQVLQEERGLLYGRRAADYLAAVSGGSFTAASYTLGSQHRATDGGGGPDPL